MLLADATIFLACALSLAAFDISKMVRDGVIVEPVCEYKTGFIRQDTTFLNASRDANMLIMTLLL